MSEPSRAYQTGTAWGRPEGRMVTRMAVRAPSARNSCCRARLIGSGMLTQLPGAGGPGQHSTGRSALSGEPVPLPFDPVRPGRLVQPHGADGAPVVDRQLGGLAATA